MTSILIDDDLLLRSYKLEDAADLFHCVDLSRAHLRPFLNWVDHTTQVAHSLQFIQSSLAQQNAGEALSLGIFLQQEHCLIGGIGLHHWHQDEKRAQIGYWVAKEFEGRGFMTRSASRLVDFAFQKLGLNKVEIHCLSRNSRSLALAHRLGFQTEGCIRQSYRSVAGALEDVVVSGMLRDEWK
ncbi:MAG: GNAT family N-acetyltransferase, partial [Bacteroidetes bacterium]|nr:GNAT family N-acetyltransferase [Bacteroidota bacterium]